MKKEIDTFIHQPTRLKIMASLFGLAEDASTDFTFVKKQLSLSDGNLSVQLQKLEEAGFVLLEKAFVNRKPKTWIRLTGSGRQAFEEYIAAMESLIHGSRDMNTVEGNTHE